MISAKVAFSLRREESRIANDRVIHRSFQVPVHACLNSAIVSAERLSVFVVWALARTRCCVARAEAHATGCGSPFSTYKN
jgi:hypothetical protein